MTDQENAKLTIMDICISSGLSVMQLTDYIEEGLIDVTGSDVEQWRFSETHLILIKKVSRLEQDLRLNSAGAVLALELMREIERLRKKLNYLDPRETML